MKKMLIIIVILSCILVGMIIYRQQAVGTKDNVNVQDIKQIEEYITKIYGWKEVTNQALPEFEDINNADKLWLWEMVKKNLDDYELTYDQINNKAEELFGKDFKNQFPKEGNDSIEYDEQTDKYYNLDIELDSKEDSFLLDKIEKNKEGYIARIIEYEEDYSSENSIIITNTNEEEIGRVSNNDNETKIQEIVKQNMDRFTKKEINLEKQEERLIVKSVKIVKD